MRDYPYIPFYIVEIQNDSNSYISSFSRKKVYYLMMMFFVSFRSIRFNISSETDTWNMANKWLNSDGSSEQKNTWNSYSSSTSTATENNNLNSTYTISEGIEPHALHSASMMLSLEDFDVSRSSSQQVFI